MPTEKELRRRALALPEVVEQDHHGFPSFRVGGRIFATLPDAGHAHLMLAAADVAEALAADPEAFEELHWGKRLAGVRVELARVDGDALVEFLIEAWRGKAPRRLVERFEGGA